MGSDDLSETRVHQQFSGDRGKPKQETTVRPTSLSENLPPFTNALASMCTNTTITSHQANMSHLDFDTLVALECVSPAQ
jgi:hypothetical protein